MTDERTGGHSTPAPTSDPDGASHAPTAETDGGIQAYTVRLELVDEPGELLRALQPISENGGNLLSIHHERGNITPRGHIPVEVDLECAPTRFDEIVDALRDAGINVIQAGPERYGEELTVVLVGHLVETDLSDTLSSVSNSGTASVLDLSLAAPDGMEDVSSARVRLAIDSGNQEAALESLRALAETKDLCLVEPLTGGGA